MQRKAGSGDAVVSERLFIDAEKHMRFGRRLSTLEAFRFDFAFFSATVGEGVKRGEK